MSLQNWKHLVDRMPDLLAPSMAKDHPNLPVVKEEGCYYYGLDGKKYLDFTSGIAVTNTGHRHPKVVNAIKDAADSLVHGPSGVIMYDSILQLADQLGGVLPDGLDCFFFANSGTEAIEGAIKLAKHVTERPFVVSFTGCFHGRSMGALNVTTSKSKYRKFLNPSGSYQIPYFDASEYPLDQDTETYSLMKLEKDFEKIFKHQVSPDEVACVILEPVLGEGGYIIPPAKWLQKIRQICDQHDILLIFDEVQTGFGRTGEWFAAQKFDVNPDIMAIAKGIASGLPLSATVASKELMKKWPLGTHGTTFGGNPIACSAALATLEVIKEEKLVENAQQMGEYVLGQLEILQLKHPDVISSVRGIGLMIGIELIDPQTKRPSGDTLLRILDIALEKGVLFYLCGNEGNVIRMVPPLIVTKDQIDDGLQMLDEAIELYKIELEEVLIGI